MNPIFDKENLITVSEKIKTVNQILITAHKGPDGDAVGSSLALYHFLTKLNDNVKIILPDSFPRFFNWMKASESILFYEYKKNECDKVISESDLIFFLDYNDIERAGIITPSLKNSSALKVMIDHHRNPTGFADINFSDDSSCSTAELIYEFIESLDLIDLLDTTIAEGIYTGILTDTGSFRFPSVKAKTHLIISKLIELGLQHHLIHEQTFDTNSANKLKLNGYALTEKLDIINDEIAVISLTEKELQKYQARKGDTEGLVNQALSIEGIKVAVFAKESDGIIKLSFRSKGEIAVNEFSSLNFSGGGHKNAAGGKSDLPIDEALLEIKKLLPLFLEES